MLLSYSHRFSYRRALFPNVLLGLFTVLIRPAWGAPPEATFLGGSGDDEARSVAMDSQGAIYIGGRSTSATIAGIAGTTVEPGEGFIAKLAADGRTLLWLARLGDVQELALDGADRLLVRTSNRVAILTPDGTGLDWQSGDLGETVDFASDGESRLAVVSSSVTLFDVSTGSELWTKDVGRSHPAAVTVDPSTGNVFVSGDHNTNTGYEPWRSPFLHILDSQTGERLDALYDFPGASVREDGRMLQADSFITQLEFGSNGALYMGGGSDGGNTVLKQEPSDMDVAQDALVGACFDGPCFGYKGAKKTGMFGRFAGDYSDLERASWLVPYIDIPAGGHHDPACGCKGGNFEGGSTVNPGSFATSSLLPFNDELIVLGNPWGVASTSPNAWYRDTKYTGGGIGWVGIFDSDLKTLSQATMLPGTKSAMGTLRGGRLLIVGRAQSQEAPSDPAEAGWLTHLPTIADGLQPDYAGGENDGYLLIACLTTDDECAAIPGIDEGPGGPGGSAGTPGTGTDGSAAGGSTASGSGGTSDASGDGDKANSDEGGCGCKMAGGPRAPRQGTLAGLALLLAAGLAAKRRRNLGKRIES